MTKIILSKTCFAVVFFKHATSKLDVSHSFRYSNSNLPSFITWPKARFRLKIDRTNSFKIKKRVTEHLALLPKLPDDKTRTPSPSYRCPFQQKQPNLNGQGHLKFAFQTKS